MLDRFGQAVRDIRLTRSMLLYDMARDMGVSSAELSSIECGRQPVPAWFIPKLEQTYNIGHQYAVSLDMLVDMCRRQKST